LTKSDFLLVPVNPSWKTIYNADTWLDGITKNTSSATGGGFPKNRIGIVLNRAEEDVNFDEETVVRELSSWQYLGKIPDSKEWRRAENNGELIATRNLPEISSAFTSILHRITGEDVLTAIATQPTASRKKGLWGRRK
jgi:septum formation inhibitor-activating ATPase MinD